MPAPPPHPSRSAGEGGYALLVVTIAIISLLAAGTLLVLHLQARTAIVRDQFRNLQLQGLLDSGLAKAAATLREDPFYEGDQELELSGGRVEIDIEFASGAGLPDGLRRVVLVAHYRHEHRRAHGFIAVDPDTGTLNLYGLRPIPPGGEDAIYLH